MPALLDELDVTFSRQDRLAAPHDRARSGGEVPLPFRSHVPEVVWDLHNTLGAWVHTLARTRTCTLTTAQAAEWLARHVELARIHPAADQLADEIIYAVRRARAAIDRPGDRRRFLGPCRADGCCREELYALDGARSVACPACGAEHDVAARKDWLQNKLQGHLGTSAEIAGFLNVLGMSVTPSMIRGYVARGRLVAHATTRRGHPLFRIADVIAAARQRYQRQFHRQAS